MAVEKYNTYVPATLNLPRQGEINLHVVCAGR